MTCEWTTKCWFCGERLRARSAEDLDVLVKEHYSECTVLFEYRALI